jgi:hypothetical protein
MLKRFYLLPRTADKFISGPLMFQMLRTTQFLDSKLFNFQRLLTKPRQKDTKFKCL